MNSKTEQQIKERIDEAGLADLLPDFDWDDTWRQIGDKMEPRRKLKWQRMLPYAAILLLGLFIAGWIGFNSQQDLQVAALRQPELPVPVTKNIPLPITVKPETGSRNLAQQQEPIARPVERKPELQIPAEKKVMPETIVAVPAPAPVAEPIPVATAAPLRKVKHYLDGDAAAVDKKNSMPGPVASAPADRKVKHFLDIDNEDHNKMSPEYPTLVRVKIFRFPVKEQKGTPSYNPADLPLRTFIYAATN